MYQRPDMAISGTDPHAQNMDPRKLQEHFEDFYEDLFEELSKYGELESLNVCDNLADHMVGNVYVLFKEEEQAATALRALQGRFYAGRPIFVDFSPVTDFREATCRQYEENTCNRGGYCNFMHLKKISRDLRKKLFGASKRHSHSRSPSQSRSRSLSPRHRDFDYRNRGYDHRHREGSRYNGRHDDYSRRDSGRSRRRYSRSRSRSRSPVGRRKESSRREDSVERRAKIEQWNTEREKLQPTGAGNITSNSTGDGDSAYEDHHGR